MTSALTVDSSTLARLRELVEQERAARAQHEAAAQASAESPTSDASTPDASAPEMSDEKIRAGTGRGWDEWVTLATDGPGREASHSDVATWAIEEHGLTGWWGHGVAVGVRRLTGQRVPGQMADGTFAVSRTKTLSLPESDLREALLDPQTRAAMLPGLDVTLRSKPSSKALRLALADDGAPLGSVLFTLAPASHDRCRMTASHEKLDSAADGARWKTFWAGWLDVLDDVAGATSRVPRGRQP